MCSEELQQKLVPVRDKFKEQEDKEAEEASKVSLLHILEIYYFKCCLNECFAKLAVFSGTQAQSPLVYHQFLPFSPTPALSLVYQSVSAILSYSSSSPSLTVQLFPFSPIPFSPTPALSLLSHSSYPPSLPVQFFPFSPIPVLPLPS